MTKNLPTDKELLEAYRGGGTASANKGHLEGLRRVAALATPDSQPEATTSGRSMARFSAWIDDSYPQGMDAELVLRRRTGKIGNEFGELLDALEGYTGENPRKGVFDTKEHVMKELMDCAVAALGAWEHMDGNRGHSQEELAIHIDGLLKRVGLTESDTND
jgi:hypothetical protein